MRKAPNLYGISVDLLKDDPDLEQFRANIVHTAAFVLEKSGLVKYDRKSGHLQVSQNLFIQCVFLVCYWLNQKIVCRAPN